MSDLQLSDELVEKLQQTIIEFDSRASDPGIAVQYYAAIMGFLVGQQPAPYEDKRGYLEQLLGFTQHVFNDIAQPDETEQAQPDTPSGVWKPGDD